jgi:hypothetical protein
MKGITAKKYQFVIWILISGMFVILTSCGKNDKKTANQQNRPQLPALPDFNADSAYSFIKAQCDFGPRVPNSKAHIDCGDYMIRKMKEWSDTVYVQTGIVTAFDKTSLNFRNIISSFNPETKRRILFFAHWDTRPWADQDTFDTNKPPLGADDGGSGVGILMELARQLNLNKTDLGIDIIFFDAEDWGKAGRGPGSEDSYSLGTQYWTKKPHVSGYTAEYGILLDMTGAKGARFRREGLSRQEAGFVIDKVWGMAHSLGYSDYFLYEDGGWVTDDHVYVNRFNIPSINIINSVPGTRSGFVPHWHTHDDDMDVIDRNTLKAVGQTLLGVIFRGEATF